VTAVTDMAYRAGKTLGIRCPCGRLLGTIRFLIQAFINERKGLFRRRNPISQKEYSVLERKRPWEIGAFN
jgi:hypothetical protein